MVAVVLAQGCAGLGKGPTDEEMIMSTLTAWSTAMKAGDIDTALTSYAESYKDAEGRDKTSIKAFLSEAKTQGYLDGLEVLTDKTQVTIEEGGKGSASPVSLNGNFGGITLTVLFAKEGESWKISSVQEY